MEFQRKDPMRLGNFRNYYDFNPAEERILVLSRKFWLPENESCEPYFVLDVGCNAGVLTLKLHKYLAKLMPNRKIIIYGIDIDADLILRAKENNNDCEGVTYDCVDVMNAVAFKKVEEFMKTNNISQFDAVCCFSITMWIHLNHHDTGLQEFLSRLSSMAKLLVVEPQPWKCYQKAERRLKKLGDVFPLFLELKWRSHVETHIRDFLESTLQRKLVHETVPTKWQRTICYYK